MDTLTFERLYEEHLEAILEDILTEREQFNKTYSNSELRQEGNSLIIRWYNHKQFDDPEGVTHYSERRIPFNFLHVMDEIARQWNKTTRNT